MMILRVTKQSFTLSSDSIFFETSILVFPDLNKNALGKNLPGNQQVKVMTLDICFLVFAHIRDEFGIFIIVEPE